MYKSKAQSSHFDKSEEKAYPTISFYLDEVKEVLQNLGKICFAYALTDKRYGPWIVGLNGFPQFASIGLEYVKANDTKEECHKTYTLFSATLSFFTATAASLLACADVEDWAAKLFEGTEILIDTINGVLEEIEVCKDNEHSTCYKIFETLPTLIQQVCNLGFLCTLCSKEFADVEVMRINDIPITPKEFFPMIGIIKSLSMLGYKSVNDCIAKNPALWREMKKCFCPEIKEQESTRRIMKHSDNHKNYGTFSKKCGNLPINNYHSKHPIMNEITLFVDAKSKKHNSPPVVNNHHSTNLITNKISLFANVDNAPISSSLNGYGQDQSTYGFYSSSYC